MASLGKAASDASSVEVLSQAVLSQMAVVKPHSPF
jgi:hypothetical protein